VTGVERVVEALVGGLDPRRFVHTVVYPRRGACFESYGRHATVLDLEPGRRWDRAFVDALVRVQREQAIDLVLSHGLRHDFHAALACRRTGVPHVVSRAVALADEDFSVAQRLLYGVADGWTLRRASRIVAVSEASKRRMVAAQHLPAGRVTVIPNGVLLPVIAPDARRAARAALGVGDHERLVGGVGQLIPRKAFDRLVEALGILRRSRGDLVGVLLGEGPEREALAGLARARGVRLLMPGYVADPYPAMAAFDVAVLPSRAEGMPLVVLEAMALGVACVATPTAGTVEVVEDGRSGILVPGGAPDALAAALARLLDDTAFRMRIARAGEQRVRERFGRDAMLESFARTLVQAAAR
jgi:glycosyltransferase involved in cell wall biosynthesis